MRAMQELKNKIPVEGGQILATHHAEDIARSSVSSMHEVQPMCFQHNLFYIHAGCFVS